MRIALAWLDLADPTDRGVGEGLARELRRLGHRVCLVGPRRRMGESFHEIRAGVPVYRVGKSPAEAARQLRRIHSREEIDLWHCHVFARDHEPLARAAAVSRWPMLVTLHLVLQDYLPFVGGRRGLGRLLRAARHVTAVCRASREEFLEMFPRWRDRTSVVYNGMEPGPPTSRLRSIPRPYLLCAARLAPYKGQDLLLMAWAKIHRHYPGLRLVLCGRDQTHGGMARLARSLGLAESVLLTGDLPPARLQALLRDCEFFVLPSRRENFPLAALEAMQAGKAVLATATGGVPELLRDGREGLLVPPHDVEALSRGMRRLLSRPELCRALGRRARLRSRGFSWGAAAAAYDRLYREIHGRRP